MSKMSELAAKSEMMLMGFVIPVKNEEVILATKYCLEVMHCDNPDYDGQAEAEEVEKNIHKYDKENKNNVKYMVCNTVEDMRQITYIIESPEEGLAECEWKIPDDVNDLAGNDYFSYVYNVDVPHFSELGYTFYDFDEDTHRVHRVG